ncbi:MULTISPECIES: tetratricopeptide repeat protein [unclassified Psychrobacter]|uniref:tetratricopeptide repeat protein n=1 Tax=unclassified Psychrobacter TaxID=196806 RepID=UPI0018F603EB|nr:MULTISPECIES: tetratricopeptide repeat protein [unclassified Psychrobacter]
MKVLKAALFTAVFSVAGLANAELTANVPLDTSRFELMEVGELSARAASGNDHAQFYLAKRLQKGQGVAKNTQEAIQWYTRAAEQGVAPAQLNLAIMYLRGEGVQPNLQKARGWLEKAAMRGDNRASYTLALLDEKQQNLVDAYKWYDLAARDGMLDEKVRTKARGKIGQLALNLSSSDIASARSQADSWFQSK